MCESSISDKVRLINELIKKHEIYNTMSLWTNVLPFVILVSFRKEPNVANVIRLCSCMFKCTRTGSSHDWSQCETCPAKSKKTPVHYY